GGGVGQRVGRNRGSQDICFVPRGRCTKNISADPISPPRLFSPAITKGHMRKKEFAIMPRRPRSFIAGMPYHIVQRGNNRQPCFNDEEDRMIYLGLWKAKANYYGLPVHAY